MKKLTMLAAAGVGYVLGSRAGRERYDQIMRLAGKVKDNPRVQEQAHHAAELAREKAPLVKDKVTGAAGSAAHKVGGSRTSDPGERLNPGSLHFQENPYPKDDLP